MNRLVFNSQADYKILLLPVGLLLSILFGWLISLVGIGLPISLMAITLLIGFTLIVFNKPRVGLILFIIYSFILVPLMRTVADFPFSFGFEALLIVTWLAAIFHNSKNYDWSIARNDLTYMGGIWFIVTVLELFNPVADLNVVAWMKDARYPLLWLLIVPLSMVIFNSRKNLDTFLIFALGFSAIAAVYGVKQLKLGLSPSEEAFVLSAPTHMIWGQLRVFSFYSDAGQFGASMAHFCLVTGVLALGPYKMWKKVLFSIMSILFLYAMFISGTRGSLFVLIVGVIVVLVVTKNFKTFALILAIFIAGFAFLKFTNIGEGIYEIRRMRSALNPNDPSLTIRLENQAKIANYLKSHPFGAGVGSIGLAAETSKSTSALVSIPPDSYWVKVWANYGIIGFILWSGFMMFIIGKSCGILWNLKDMNLKFKLMALTGGYAGVFFCSYGNEVMNNMPSSMLLYFSLAFIFLGPKLDKEAQQLNAHA